MGSTTTDDRALAREIIDPATGEEFARVRDATPDEVQAAVARARDAFPAWASRTPRERSEALHALADRLAAHADDLAEAESRNVGKPRTMAVDEVDYAIDNLRFFAGAARC